MARIKKSESLTAAVSAEIKSNFNLDKFKEKKLLNGNIKFKEQKWIPLSPAFQEVTSVPGIPTGHIVLLREEEYYEDCSKIVSIINELKNPVVKQRGRPKKV